MFSKSLVPSLLVVLSLFFALASCSKSNDADSRPAHSWQSGVTLDDAVSEQGCLSLPKLFDGVRAVNPALPVVIMPTSIAFDSSVSVRENFRRLVAYGQLVIAQKTVGDIQALPNVAQDGCSKVTVTGSDGVSKDFTVKTSARDALMAEADDGERIDYTWLSPQTLQSKRRYVAYDAPCGSSDKPVLVTISRVMDWSGAGVPETVPATGSVESIDPSFLSLAAEAVGDSPDSLYVDEEGGRRLDLTKVAAMTDKAPRPEVVSCSGAAPAPTPDPSVDPSVNPAPSPDDPTRGGPTDNPDGPGLDNPNNPDSPPHSDDGGPLPSR
jgi:hypothetical protein